MSENKNFNFNLIKIAFILQTIGIAISIIVANCLLGIIRISVIKSSLISVVLIIIINGLLYRVFFKFFTKKAIDMFKDSKQKEENLKVMNNKLIESVNQIIENLKQITVFVDNEDEEVENCMSNLENVKVFLYPEFKKSLGKQVKIAEDIINQAIHSKVIVFTNSPCILRGLEFYSDMKMILNLLTVFDENLNDDMAQDGLLCVIYDKMADAMDKLIVEEE